MISIPKKIEFLNDEFENIKNVRDLTTFLNKGDQLIRPYLNKVTND